MMRNFRYNHSRNATHTPIILCRSTPSKKVLCVSQLFPGLPNPLLFFSFTLCCCERSERKGCEGLLELLNPAFGHIPCYNPIMRLFSLLFFVLAGALSASELPTPAYPLWNGNDAIADYAKRVNLPSTKTLELSDGVKLELVLIPGGKFIMGTPEPAPVDDVEFQNKIVTGQALLAVFVGALLVMLAFVVIRAVRKKRRPQLSLGRLLLVTVAAGGCVLSGMHWHHSVQMLEKANTEYAGAKARYNAANKNEKPAHPVTLTKPFYMGKFSVTQEQYQSVMGSNPSQFKGNLNPVEMVSWDDAQAFCKKLSEQTTEMVRLPTEAEWEYSCRAGTRTTYHSGDSESDLARVAWYGANSKSTTHPVGQKESNFFGLYDMHGNVWQWCQDFYGEDYYGKSEAENPQGPSQGAWRLLRGGSWYYNPIVCRSALRRMFTPDPRYEFIGFRVVLVPSLRTP